LVRNGGPAWPKAAAGAHSAAARAQRRFGFFGYNRIHDDKTPGLLGEAGGIPQKRERMRVTGGAQSDSEGETLYA
jgi:hypothetical protein